MRIGIILLSVLLWTSCFDDKGNYDYRDLGEMTIYGIVTDSWYELFAYSDTLYIPVEINSTRYIGGEQPYTYEWKFETSTDETFDGDVPQNYTVARTKDLKFVPELKAGDYYCFFIVTDTILKLQKKVDFYVRLKTVTSEGWMILCEEDGEARLDWVVSLSDTVDRISRNLWADSEVKLGKPYGISSAYDLRGSNRYVFTENGTYNIDAQDAHVGEDNDVKLKFGDMPDVVYGLATEQAIQRNNVLDLIVTRDKNLYGRNPRMSGSVYGFALNYTSDGKRFDVAPYFGHRYGGSGASVILYDETNRRFMELDDDDKNIPRPLTFAGGTAEFQAETGRDMVYMNWTKDSYTFAVLRDPSDGELYVYGIKVESDGNNYRQYYMRLNRPNGDAVKHIAFHSLYRYLFYSTDQGNIYQFDMERPDTPAQKVLSFPGETVSALKINKMVAWVAYQPWEKARENQLVVGTNVTAGDEDNCGILRIYDVPSLMKPLEKKKEYTGLGKIVDIVYRERGK